MGKPNYDRQKETRIICEGYYIVKGRQDPDYPCRDVPDEVHFETPKRLDALSTVWQTKFGYGLGKPDG